MIVDQLFEQAFKNHWKDERFSHSGWKKEVLNNWRNHLQPTFGCKKLESVTRKVVKAWHLQLKDNPYAANRSKAILSKLINWALDNELVPNSFLNPCLNVPNHPEKKRQKYFGAAEIARIGAILEREKDNYPKEVAFLYLLMFTGSRPRAIERATQNNLGRGITINGAEFGLLRFVGKTGDEEVVIPPQALIQLDRIPKPKDGSLIGIKMPRLFWDKIRIEAGCPDLWARDFRRTFATLARSKGISIDAIGGMLNHKSRSTTELYAQIIPLEKMGAVLTTANHLSEILKG